MLTHSRWPARRLKKKPRCRSKVARHCSVWNSQRLPSSAASILCWVAVLWPLCARPSSRATISNARRDSSLSAGLGARRQSFAKATASTFPQRSRFLQSPRPSHWQPRPNFGRADFDRTCLPNSQIRYVGETADVDGFLGRIHNRHVTGSIGRSHQYANEYMRLMSRPAAAGTHCRTTVFPISGRPRSACIALIRAFERTKRD